jgi:chemotaxis family two-component system sensor kinase Cph1
MNNVSCDTEPIHAPGLIQPHGALLVFSTDDFNIKQASTNAAAFLGLSMEHILGQPIEKFFSGANQELARWLRDTSFTQHAAAGPLFERTDKTSMETAAHEFQGNRYMELFRSERAEEKPSPSSFARIKSALTQMEQSVTTADFCQKAAEQVQRFTGFDRVMIYKFFDDDSGSVVAEAALPGLNSFQNHHFPASDIPNQARELYRKSWVRIIPDVAAVSVPLSAGALDMSYCLLRSVSPVHIDYLRNMGVGASMSLSILKGDRLWGLIACHHSSAKSVASDVRAACELIAHLMSVQIDGKERQDMDHHAKELQRVKQVVVEGLDKNILFDSLEPALGSDVLRLLAASGFVFQLADRRVILGEVPDACVLQSLSAWLDKRAGENVLAFDHLPDDLPFRELLTQSIGGFLAIRISHQDNGFLIWFRPEWVHTIPWAGNPYTPKESAEDTGRLNPRKSFELWQETVRGHSLPWHSLERRWAEGLRRALIEILLRRTEKLLAQLNQTLESRILQRTHELEIATDRIQASLLEKEILLKEVHHRVKNNLQVISSLLRLQSSYLSEGKETDALLESRNRIQSMALVHDLLYQSRDLSQINFKNYLSGLLTHILKSYNGDQRGLSFTLDADDIPINLDAAIPCGLIMTELVSNALKHGFPDGHAGRIDVTLKFNDSQAITLQVDDNGIGLPSALDWKKSASLGFTIIQALCRQIKCSLETSAKDAGGTRFTLTLPGSMRA